jgi:hypothetical protein
VAARSQELQTAAHASFGDPRHVASLEPKNHATRTPPPKPDCCIQKGFYWGKAILYPAGAHWKDVLAFVFWNGPVVRIVPTLENSLNEAH